MKRDYLFEVTVTVQAESLQDAMKQAHAVADAIEDPYLFGDVADVQETYLGEAYWVIDERGIVVDADS